MGKDKAQMYIALGVGGVVLFLVLIFLGVIPGLQTASDKGATLTLWGFEDQKAVWEPVLRKYQEVNPKVKITYIQKDLASFESNLLNTLSLGQAPDIMVFPAEYLQKHGNKLSLAPVGFITERQLVDTQIDAATSFWAPAQQSVVGLPFYGDALVLYSNKNLLTKHFFTAPPKTWDDFLNMSQQITERDSAGNITVAGAALGRSVNIHNASDILMTLFLQFGENIIDKTNRVTLGDEAVNGDVQIIPADSALRFFSDFANPKKASYAWSFALPEAQEMFLEGRLGFYIGFMSEYTALRAKNPHLDLAVSLLPQLTNAPRPITYGKLYILTVPATAKNYAAAWSAIGDLTSPTLGLGSLFADNMNTVLPRRDFLANYRGEAIRSVFANSMLALKLWRIPDPLAPRVIFSSMIEDFALGRGNSGDVLRNAKIQLQRIISTQQ